MISAREACLFREEEECREFTQTHTQTPLI